MVAWMALAPLIASAASSAMSSMSGGGQEGGGGGAGLNGFQANQSFTPAQGSMNPQMNNLEMMKRRKMMNPMGQMGGMQPDMNQGGMY